jgi:1,6-anhydro-N-acetylmuramate kinase
MSGTSLDAIDVALVAIEGNGLEIGARLLRSHSLPLGALGERLRDLAEQHAMTAREIATLAHELALAHVSALGDLLRGERVDLIAVHGQTVFHAPPVSWQLVSAAPIAHALRAPVVSDLRAADLVAGGQGAPITPIADFILFRDESEHRAIANLGGFCNVTLLARGHELDLARVQARDVCACNQVLDAIARACLGTRFDDGGTRAAAGRLDSPCYEELLAGLASQSGAKRSLGTGDELGALVSWLARRVRGEDLARSACAAVAETIARAVDGTDRLLLAGGGVHNRALVGELRARSRAAAETTEAHAIPAHDREAVAMAILGALAQDRVPITLPQVTSCRAPAPVAGSWVMA